MSRHVIVFLLLCTANLYGQEPTASTILTNALNSAGGTALLQGIHDLTAMGTITYYWAGKEVKGTASVRALESDKFRLDANLLTGTRSLVVTRFGGQVQEPGGDSHPISLHNTINLGILSFPHLNLLAALSDSLTDVSLVGTVKIQDYTAYDVRVQRNFPKSFDPVGALTELCKTDYFIDSTTRLLLKTVDMTHPDRTMNQDFLHELEFDNYMTVKGLTKGGRNNLGFPSIAAGNTYFVNRVGPFIRGSQTIPYFFRGLKKEGYNSKNPNYFSMDSKRGMLFNRISNIGKWASECGASF